MQLKLQDNLAMYPGRKALCKHYAGLRAPTRLYMQSKNGARREQKQSNQPTFKAHLRPLDVILIWFLCVCFSSVLLFWVFGYHPCYFLCYLSRAPPCRSLLSHHFRSGSGPFSHVQRSHAIHKNDDDDTDVDYQYHVGSYL